MFAKSSFTDVSQSVSHTGHATDATAAAPADVRSALAAGIAHLAANQTPSAALSAEVLLLHVLCRDRAWLYAHPEYALTSDESARYGELLRRRAAGTPTQYLTGHQEFWGLDFEVTPDVLIPRPETEHVVELALSILRKSSGPEFAGPLRIADVGTGSGCLAVALASELPHARITASDISPRALAVAARNALRCSVGDRIEFAQMNLLADFLSEGGASSSMSPQAGARRFHLIVSNPPYVGRREASQLPADVRDHEPAEALFGGEHGTELYAPLIDQAARLLFTGGALVLELGYNSGGYVGQLFVARPEWTNVALTNDLAGIPRVLSAVLA